MSAARRAIVRRTTIVLALAIVVLTGTTATGGAGSNLAAANTLHAVVESTTPLTLELTISDGGRVHPGGIRVLAPGTYTVVVEDRSSFDNFHLGGPGIDEQTTLEFVGTVTWMLNFTLGAYSYRTDGAGAPKWPACACGQDFSVRQPAPAQLRGTVAARTISLKTIAGASALNVAAGEYVILVNDRSGGNNFHLSGKGVNRRTGVKFVGRKTWTITLAPGSLYTYRSDSNSSLRRTFRTHD